MPEEKETITSADIGTINIAPSPVKKLHVGATHVRKAFCAACQAETDHTCGLDKNQEVLCVCGCGRFIKVPVMESPADFESHLAAHKDSNVGQVTVEMAAAEQEKHDARFKKMMGIE